MAKAKAVQKTTKPTSKKATAASLQSPKKTSGRTTMNSSATAIQSMPIGRFQEMEKKGAAGKKKKTATKSKPEPASKKPALKIGVRGKTRAVVDKGKSASKSSKGPIAKKTAQEQSKSGKNIQTKPAENKKASRNKQNQPVAPAPKKGRPPKKEERKPEKAPLPTKKSENESPKKQAKVDIKTPVKSEPTKAAARTKSTESVNGQKSTTSSRGPSRRESASSAVTPRSSRKSSVNSVGGKPTVVKVKQQKESSPGPTSRSSRRNTSTSEKRESKSPSPRPSRKSSTTKEADDSKPSDRSRRKSGSVSVPSLPSSRQSSPSRTSPAKKTKEGPKKTKEELKKKNEDLTSKKVKEEPKEEPTKSKEAASSKKVKEEPKKTKEDSKTKKTKDEPSSGKKVIKSEPVEIPKRRLSAQKGKEQESKKSAGKEKPKRTERKAKESKIKKKTEKTAQGSNRTGSKRASTALATANSKAQSLALKSLSDDRSFARKLATKAIKASKAKVKPKPKPQLKLRPKLKKRMASLNAKAILEASFSETEKKQKSVSPPKSSPSKSSMNVFSPPTTAEATRQAIDGITSPSELAARYENLLSDLKIEIRSGPPPDNSYSQSEDEDKRKSKKRKTPRVDVAEEPKAIKPTSEMGTSTSTSTETVSKPKKSKTSKDPPEEEVSSKKVRKEASVGTSETSTSTPAWGWETTPYVPPPPFPPHPHPALTRYAVESTMIHQEPAGIRRTHQVYHTSHGPNGIESRLQEGVFHQVVDGTQYHHHTKENQTRPPPVALYDGTVYQPAGPMIEQQKGPNLGLPQTVKLPPDLKVTYQTHPPSENSSVRKESSTTTTRSQKLNRVSEAKSGSSRNKSKPATTTTSSSAPKAVVQTPPTVLHQPYKPAEVASSTRTVKVHQTTVVPAGNGAVTTTTNSSSFSVYGGGGAGSVMGSPGSGGSAISQQHTLASTNLAIHHPGLAVPNGGMYYPGFMGPPSQSPFSPNKYPMLPPESIRPPYLPVPPTAPSGFYLSPFYHSPLSVGGVPGLGSHPRALMPAPSAAAATAYYQQTLGSPSAAATTPHGSFLSPSASAGSSSHLQPSLHSIPSQSSPGHAGPFRPNPSSHPPACPCPPAVTDISRHRSIINNINTTNSRFSSIINTKLPQRQQQLQQQPRPRQSATLVDMRQGCENNIQTTTNQRRSNPSLLSNEKTSTSRNYPVSALNTTGGRHAKGLLVPAIGAAAYSAEDTLKPSNHIDIQPTENGKTYSEQYSLPDDITITPILVVPEGAATAASTNKIQSVAKDLRKHVESNSAKTSMHGPNKQKDIVHVINPRSGQTTTIAKHISNSSSLQSHISPSKKIISPVKPNNAGNVGKINPDLDVIVIPAGQDRDQFLASYASQSTRTMCNKRVFQTSALSSSNSTNVIGSAFKSQHWSGRPTLAGKSGSRAAVNFVQPLQVQIPGDHSVQHQRNKRKGILDQVVDGLQKKRLKESGHMIFDRNRPNLTIQPKSPTSSARTMAKDQIFQMRSSTIVNEQDALVAVSALVVPAYGVRLSPLKNGLRRGSTGSWSGKGKIATRSAIANAKIRTRSAIARRPLVGSSRVSPDHVKKLVRKRMAGKSADHWAHRRIPHGQRYNFVQRWKKAHAETSSVNSETSSTSSSNGAGSSVSSGQRSYSSSAIPVTTALAKMQESGGRIRGQVPGSLAFNALKKRAIVKPLSPNTLNGSLHTMMMARRQPKWSNGWRFEGEPFQAKVYLKNDDQPVIRRCYPAMRHDSGDVIQPRDCVLLKSGPRKTDLPFVAKVAALWENPTDGEMMFSLLWYYRPEHTDVGRTREDMMDEIFASKHRDCNSVATIEDRCYVLTLNEYCRYKKRLKQLEENIPDHPPIVPLSDSPQSSISNFAANIALAVWQGKQLDGNERLKVPAAGKVASEVVFFCRKVYDFKSKRLLKNPS